MYKIIQKNMSFKKFLENFGLKSQKTNEQKKENDITHHRVFRMPNGKIKIEKYGNLVRITKDELNKVKEANIKIINWKDYLKEGRTEKKTLSNIEKAEEDAKLHPDAPPIPFWQEGGMVVIKDGSVVPASREDIQKRREWEEKQKAADQNSQKTDNPKEKKEKE